MARPLHKLSAPEVMVANKVKHSDGGGLWLYKRADGGAQWVLRYTLHRRRHEIGLGARPGVSLNEARKEAEKWRGVVQTERRKRFPVGPQSEKLELCGQRAPFCVCARKSARAQAVFNEIGHFKS